TSVGGGGLRYGVVHTTAKTTPAGLTMTIARRTAANIRTGRARTKETNRLFVREIFQLGGELADPTTVVEPPNETTVALVSRHVQELLLRDQRPKPGQVRICVVSH